MGVDPSLNHIYVGPTAQGFLEVREGNSGNLLGTVTLHGVSIYSVARRYLYSITDAY